MHLGIVELCEKNHHSMIYNWIKIANINGWEITLFTTEEIFKNVENELIGLEYNIFLKKELTIFFLYKIKKYSKNKDMNKIIFLTLCKFINHLFISYEKYNIGITVHNANTWFNHSIIRRPMHYLKRYITKKVKKESKFFILNSKNMKNFILDNKYEKKPLLVLPFSLKKSIVDRFYKNKEFVVVYPGGINHLRKKYDNFIKLAILNPSDLFIVLGTCSTNEIDINIYNDMKKYKNIKLYKSYIEINEFNDVMKKADVLFSDIVVDFNLSDMSEKYGITKDSGISYLMNEFTIPCILNKEFNNLHEMNSSSIYFSNENELINKYKKLKNVDYYNNLVKNLKNDTKDFNLIKFAKEMRVLENENIVYM